MAQLRVNFKKVSIFLITLQLVFALYFFFGKKASDLWFYGPVSLDRSVLTPDATSADSVTWVTQCTIDRVFNLDILLERWTGPVSVCLYSTDIKGDVERVAKWRSRVDFHFVPQRQRLYPVNALRNVALDNARSEYVFLADIDFIPNVGAHEYLREVARTFAPMRERRAVVVAAAFMHYRGGEDIPLRKEELLYRMDMGEMDMVHRDAGRDVAHNATNYPMWRTATEPYRIAYRFPYEPYYMARRDVPRFDETFIGYGNDKTEQTYELDVAGYEFWGGPGIFVVHKEHTVGGWAVQETLENRLKRTMANLYQFMRRVQIRHLDVEPSAGTPPTNLRPTRGGGGQTCEEVCGQRSLRCDESLFPFINTCRFVLAHLPCNGCSKFLTGADLPALDTSDDALCLVNGKDREPSECAGPHHPNIERLCPCVSE